ncbi:MAG: thioredoxin [Acidobacteria bacterium]|nr:thioredoxin [Acidobacteriota bacterium]
MNENVRELTTENWESEVLSAAEPVLVDFWAEWCAPCRMIAPTIDALATEYAGRVKVGKLNVDENEEIAGRYGIRSIPTLLVFRGGAVVEQRVGAAPKADVARILDAHVGAPAGR